MAMLVFFLIVCTVYPLAMYVLCKILGDKRSFKQIMRDL